MLTLLQANLNSRLVWYSNGKKQSINLTVYYSGQYSNGEHVNLRILDFDSYAIQIPGRHLDCPNDWSDHSIKVLNWGKIDISPEKTCPKGTHF